MVFHTKLYQNPVTLDRSSFIGPVINGQNNNPIPTIPRVILKDIKNYAAFTDPVFPNSTPQTEPKRSVSVNLFQYDMISNINGPNAGCSSCGGSK